MTFVDKIIAAGFVEQGQKKLLELIPHKERWIPRWWEQYNTSVGWLGLNTDHPDAWFKKDGEDKEMQLSLQGVLCALLIPQKEEHEVLFENGSVRYICLKIGDNKIFETFSGQIPPESIVHQFIETINLQTGK